MQVCFYCHKVFPFIIPVGEIVLCKDCAEKLKKVSENISNLKTSNESQKVLDYTNTIFITKENLENLIKDIKLKLSNLLI